MKKLLTPVVLLLVLFAAAADVQAAEYYIEFRISSPEELRKLTNVVSLDHVPPTKDGLVRAYANDAQLVELERLGYTWEVLQHPGTLIEPEMSSNLRDLRDWDTYPTYDAYIAMMYQFETDYPDLCEIINIGQSEEGRDILYARISDNIATEEYEPEVMYTSSMHGDEITGYVLTLRLIDSLLVAYGTDPAITRLVDSTEIWINPLANPDGTYASGNHTVSGATRYNSNGVDLNRNFPDPQNGPHPDGNSWQDETVVMMNIAEAQNFVISANFHGGTEVVNYPWDTWPQLHADDPWYQDISHQYADSAQSNSPSGYMNGYNDGITNGYDWYEVNGGRQDFMNYWYGCREVTIEISDVKLIPASQLPAHWVYNRISMLEWLEHGLEGIRGIVTDAVSGLPVAATISVMNHDIDSSEVYTDPDVGDYYRMIEIGNYDLVFSAPGYYPDTVFGVSYSGTRSTIVDVALQPLPNEPDLVFVSHNIGPVDPGESVSMDVTLQNNGAGNATNTVGTLTTEDIYITLTQNTSSYTNITALGGTATTQTPYQFDILPGCPDMHVVTFTELLSADGGYVDSVSYSFTVGLDVESFESGDFTFYPWQMSGNQPWQIVSTEVYDGAYSAKSGDISHSSTSTMQVTLDSLEAGTVSFYYKVSSESGYDYLRFYIDGQQKNQWSGEVAWTVASYAVNAGTHTFRWTYYKDVSVSNGSDCGWVDYITFPQINNDSDDDGIINSSDNCPTVYNPFQEDEDGDNVGDSCDNCFSTYNPGQEDTDSDALGDSCDNCYAAYNPSQEDADADLVGDSCDNCLLIVNADQADADADLVGDSCDNCLSHYNPAQEDADADAIGDSCDNCLAAYNPSQEDIDSDLSGDSCDNCVLAYNPAQADSDIDGVGDSCDNCIDTYNPGQADADSDGVGDACEYICGDMNGDGEGPDVEDLTYVVDYLFRGGDEPPNTEAADIDGEPEITVSDLSYLVDYIFRGGPEPDCG